MSKKYKEIIYREYPELSLLEFDVVINGISTMKEFILKVSTFVELTAIKNYKFVMFNKLNSDFEIHLSMKDFAHKLVIDQIFYNGVQELLFLLNAETYKKYQNISRNNIKAFKKFSDIEEYINNYETTNSK